MSRRARGHIKKRGQNSHSLVLSVNDPVTGQRKRIWRTVQGNKREAEAALTRLLAEYDQGAPPTSGDTTVGEWLDRWLRDIVARRNRPRTVQSYESIIRVHLKPNLGNLRLVRLGPDHIDRLMSTIIDSGRSANTALHVFTALRKALRDAERMELVRRNVCQLAYPPRFERKVIDPPDMAAIRAILGESKSTPYGPIIEFMARTGLRRGEAVALSWKNVDFGRGVVMVVESAVRIRGKGIVFEPTKSAAGRRSVAIDPGTVDVLRHHRANQAEHVLGLGGVYRERNLIFAGQVGDPIDLDHLSHGFKKIATAAGYPRTRLHDLRHAHAAGLFKAGTHPRVVQERLGHSSAAFTMDVYGHVMAGMQEQAAKDFATLLAK